MSYNEFQRESLVRHQSEKLLDRDIVRFERKQVIENFEVVAQKKLKLEEDERRAKEAEAARLKGIEIKSHEALDKVLKHFSNQKKMSKALILFKDIIMKNFDQLEADHICYGMWEFMKYFRFASTAEDKKHIATIFQFIEDNKAKILKKYEFKKIYEVWALEGNVHTQLFTDDNYQFNNALKKVKDIIEELSNPVLPGDDEPEPEQKIQEETKQPPQEEEKQEQKKVIDSIRNKLQKKPVEDATKKPEGNIVAPQPKVAQPKYEFTVPQECLDDIKSKQKQRDLKRDILFEITKDLYEMYKQTWAKAAIKQYFDGLYYQRDIFNEEQKIQVEDFKAGLSSSKGFDAAKGFKRDDLDSKIMSNPLNARNEVKDARSTSFAFDGLGKWAGRQGGI